MQDVGFLGLFSDWPATTNFCANCKRIPALEAMNRRKRRGGDDDNDDDDDDGTSCDLSVGCSLGVIPAIARCEPKPPPGSPE